MRVCVFVCSQMLADLEKSSVILFGDHLSYQDVKSSIPCSFSALQPYTGERRRFQGRRDGRPFPDKEPFSTAALTMTFGHHVSHR